MYIYAGPDSAAGRRGWNGYGSCLSRPRPHQLRACAHRGLADRGGSPAGPGRPARHRQLLRAPELVRHGGGAGRYRGGRSPGGRRAGGAIPFARADLLDSGPSLWHRPAGSRGGPAGAATTGLSPPGAGGTQFIKSVDGPYHRMDTLRGTEEGPLTVVKFFDGFLRRSTEGILFHRRPPVVEGAAAQCAT